MIGPSSGVDIGSEMSGDVYDVIIRNAQFHGSLFAVRIKSGRGRGGLVRNITLENAVLDKVASGLVITMHYASGGEPAPPNADLRCRRPFWHRVAILLCAQKVP